jgi:hypothetical protein
VQEREEAAALFGGESGARLQQSIAADRIEPTAVTAMTGVAASGVPTATRMSQIRVRIFLRLTSLFLVLNHCV